MCKVMKHLILQVTDNVLLSSKKKFVYSRDSSNSKNSEMLNINIDAWVQSKSAINTKVDFSLA